MNRPGLQRAVLLLVALAAAGCSPSADTALRCERGAYHVFDDGGPDGTVASCDCSQRPAARTSRVSGPPLQLAACEASLLGAPGRCCATPDYPGAGLCICAEGATSCPITDCGGAPCGGPGLTVAVDSCLPGGDAGAEPPATGPEDAGPPDAGPCQPERWGQPCASAAECGPGLSCFPTCHGCQAHCQVACRNDHDCIALGAGSCVKSCPACSRACSAPPARCP